jgi:hypothetical protein
MDFIDLLFGITASYSRSQAKRTNSNQKLKMNNVRYILLFFLDAF